MWSAETLELLCAGAWRAVTEDKIGDWHLRAATDADGSGGRVPFTGRANTALTTGDPGLEVPRALKKVCDFAHTEGIPPAVQTVEGSETEREIAAAGWVRGIGHAAASRVAVLVGPLGTGAEEVTIGPEPTVGWWELTTGGSRPSPAQRHVLTTGEIGYGTAEVAGVTAGAVRAAISGDVLFVARLAVRAEYRRRGLAKALMAACGPWAAERGARACVLQVALDNAPALALYSGLGFREHHRYSYWAPESPCEDRSL